MKKVFITIATLFLSLMTLGINSDADTTRVKTDRDVNVKTAVDQNTNLLFNQVDDQNRPVYAHFVGTPANRIGKRVGNPDIPSNMNSWLPNPRVRIGTNSTGFLWNRGHMIANQFAGLVSNDGINIVAQTQYTNQVLVKYFEDDIAKVMDSMPADAFFLDYSVRVSYNGNDQIPNKIYLKYRGQDAAGNVISIIPQENNSEGIVSVKQENKFTVVELENIQPGYKVNYSDGSVDGTVNADKSSSTNQQIKPAPKKGTWDSLTIREKKQLLKIIVGILFVLLALGYTLLTKKHK